MKKWMLALLCVMLFLPICAQAAITFPADLTNIEESAFEGDQSLSGLVILPGSYVTVGPRAFANTNIYALKLNGTIEENALENTYIAYIYTPESGGFHYTVENNFCFWFGAYQSNIRYGYVATKDLVEHDGFYYYCPYGWNSSPRYFLCPVDCVGLDKIEYIPGVDMTYAVMPHCEDVILGVPAGTTVPEGLNVQYYDKLQFNSISVNTDMITTDVPFTFTADVTGGHGDITLHWTYSFNGGEAKTVTADELTFTYNTPGTLKISVYATDSVGNKYYYKYGNDISYTIYPYSYQEPKLTSLTVNADELIINSPYTFTAATSNVLDGTTYAWEIYAANGDLACSQTTSKPTLTWTPTVADSYLVSVTTSTDVMGNNASIQEEFTFISDIKPIEVVAITANASTLTALNEYTFTCTTANSMGSVTYSWLFNDGGFEVTETTTTPSITFMPVFSGELSVSVTATDSNGSATLVRGFPIECTGLTMTRLTPTEDTALESGETYTFSNNATCSCAEISYEWTIVSDAGTYTTTSSRASLEYKIPSTSFLTVTCTATDGAGNSITLTNNYDLTPKVPITVNPLSVSGELVLEAYITVSTTASGGNGALSYSWALTTPAGTSTTTTTGPSMSFYPGITGLYQITLTVSDPIGQTASVSTEFTIEASAQEPETNPVTYRALLVGNTYPGTSNYLPGTDQDVYALSKVLKSMTTTPYTVTEKINVTASTIHSSITSAFSGADENDISFFYYSGHGASGTGKLCGTNNTYVSPSELRTWLDTIPGTKIVMLDSCFSGAHINKSANADPEAFNNAIISAFSWTSKGSSDLASNGYIVLTACSKTQTSSSLTTTGDHSFGAFTYGVCYTGGYDHFQQEWFQSSLYGDSNSNGYTSLGEALAVVKERINYLNSMMSDPMEQSVQYYGSTSFDMWGK